LVGIVLVATHANRRRRVQAVAAIATEGRPVELAQR
jgi:hypothetical protein